MGKGVKGFQAEYLVVDSLERGVGIATGGAGVSDALRWVLAG